MIRHPVRSITQFLILSQALFSNFGLWSIFSKHVFTFVDCKPTIELWKYQSVASLLLRRLKSDQIVWFWVIGFDATASSQIVKVLIAYHELVYIVCDSLIALEDYRRVVRALTTCLVDTLLSRRVILFSVIEYLFRLADEWVIHYFISFECSVVHHCISVCQGHFHHLEWLELLIPCKLLLLSNVKSPSKQIDLVPIRIKILLKYSSYSILKLKRLGLNRGFIQVMRLFWGNVTTLKEFDSFTLIFLK